MSMGRSAPLIAAVVLAASALAPTAALAQAASREGFWCGIGGGAGRAEVTCDDCDDESRKTGGSGYVKAGWTLNPRVLLGGELNVWTRREDLGDSDAWLTMYNASATVTLYTGAATSARSRDATQQWRRAGSSRSWTSRSA